jgi:hypothetical protein
MKQPQSSPSLWRQAVSDTPYSESLRSEDIAALAYEKYLRRVNAGRGPLADWLDAERELRRRTIAGDAV